MFKLQLLNDIIGNQMPIITLTKQVVFAQRNAIKEQKLKVQIEF